MYYAFRVAVSLWGQLGDVQLDEGRGGMKPWVRSKQLPAEIAGSLVYGAPYETAEGATVITVTRVGGILRTTARPVGVFAIHDGKTSWTPAVDGTRIAMLGELIGLLSAVIATLAVLRRPPWPDLSRGALRDLRRRD
ncbi:hypothetical protein ACLMAL_11760 [Nocardia sp. CWNU-33]|uniref:hypothetical protein n=1 Tax=Nocardia sp. CWNU-33 TaxID=3392117 RepID=UPI00398F6BF5